MTKKGTKRPEGDNATKNDATLTSDIQGKEKNTKKK